MLRPAKYNNVLLMLLYLPDVTPLMSFSLYSERSEAPTIPTGFLRASADAGDSGCSRFAQHDNVLRLPSPRVD